MSSTASLELCRELYELSKWKGVYSSYASEDWVGFVNDGYNPKVIPDGSLIPKGAVPAYDLGYLLRKLPKTIDLGKPKVRDLHVVAGGDCWIADYKYRSPHEQEWMHMYDNAKLTEADTPEDAVARLAIELFKQGAL